MSARSPLGANLRRLRLASTNPGTGVRYTVDAAADELGVAPRTLLKWERGESEPNYEYLTRLAEFYETTVPALFEPSES